MQHCQDRRGSALGSDTRGVIVEFKASDFLAAWMREERAPGLRKESKATLSLYFPSKAWTPVGVSTARKTSLAGGA